MSLLISAPASTRWHEFSCSAGLAGTSCRQRSKAANDTCDGFEGLLWLWQSANIMYRNARRHCLRGLSPANRECGGRVLLRAVCHRTGLPPPKAAETYACPDVHQVTRDRGGSDRAVSTYMCSDGACHASPVWVRSQASSSPASRSSGQQSRHEGDADVLCTLNKRGRIWSKNSCRKQPPATHR